MKATLPDDLKSTLQFTLLLQSARRPGRQVKPNYAILLALLLAGFGVTFFILSILGGVVAAMIYAPVLIGVVAVVLLLLIFGKGVDSGARREIRLEERGISANFPPFRIPVSWDQIRSVQLRFGVLTITYRDDTSRQYPVQPFDFEPEQLELFAAAQILKANR